MKGELLPQVETGGCLLTVLESCLTALAKLASTPPPHELISHLPVFLGGGGMMSAKRRDLNSLLLNVMGPILELC